ncbi:tripartite tricarboxylate transporter substrate binding protein [Ramlibacter sp. AW1]|uniref:Tripartite tricarboxylate transporter substrate binding protein n=1 Tax=Ramlibacter aurantiacus TaxID=2801330 RepID=A0A936ZHL4_9BURK|nr:tripartite tricarboxylate transporter substrate binding protein [Ramlibacter aurantiacus]MBL0421047.1 tripartite tricarboxylate transporter substrate binding protein [Ramlibacter aurantiacus]
MTPHSRNRRHVLAALASLCALPAIGQTAAPAESWPRKAVQIVVPFAAGGATDVQTRMIGQQLTERWGQAVVVDNKAGGTGAIGSLLVARATPDGHTLLMGTASTHSVSPAVNPKLSYKLGDFAPAVLVATFPNMLVVHPDVPARSVPELIKLLKERPGEFNFGSTGNGGSVHLAGELFMQATGTRMTHIPFKGSGQAVGELVAGRVQVAFDNIPAMLPQVRAGKLRALAVTGLQRLPSMPDLPTVAETVPGFEATTWIGLFAPAGTPASILDKIAADASAVVREPEMVRRFNEQGAAAAGSSPAEFTRFVMADTEKWRKVVKSAGLSLD